MKNENNSQLSKSYKQTEVGVIPEDWHVKQLGQVTAISIGGDLDKDNFSVVQDDIFNYPVFSNTVANEGLYGFSSSAEYNGASLTIVGRGVGLGTAFRRSGKFSAIGRLLVLFPELDVDAGFLAEYVNNRVTIFSESGGIPQLTGIGVAKYKVALPPTKAEQEAIAEALSDADALIESLEQLIDKKRQLKQGAMQELFRPKAGWVATNFGTVTERIVGGGTPSRTVASYWNGDIPWMTVKDFAHHSPRGTLEYITRDGLKNSASNLIPRGTIITSTRMALGKAIIFDVDVAINQDLKAIFPIKSIATWFLYYWFQFNEPRIAEMGSGSTVMGLSLSDLRKISFSKPARAEQETIAKALSDMDAEIDALEAKLAKARQLKQGMMHNLLTGKIRLI